VSNILVQDLEALIEQFKRSDWREMHLRMGDVELFLSADGSARLPERAREGLAPANAAPIAVAAQSQLTSGSPATPAVASVPAGWIQVRAPSLGSFYRAPKPGAPSFADIGARVTVDSELCLIEVMKLFTTMRSGVGGIVREVYAKDGDLVEFDQPLFLIEPDA
jgi:acetyl-CoA carboxylase biotin carboxyl carrier protein